MNEDFHKLRRAWTEELYREYDRILYRYRLQTLKPPLIMIADVTSVWGRWHPVTRTITISAALIQQYKWDVVLEVLKHEIAHQLASEVLGGDHTHGAVFQRACAMLGLASWAAHASGELPRDIPSWRDRRLTGDEERLLRRAEKLLSLATSANEHEAILAMERVRELYERHNLHRLKKQRGAAMVHLVLSRGKKRLDTAESMIGSILVEHFFVKVIFSSSFDATTLTRHKVLEVLGADENVLMAEYVYHFLYRQVHALWDTYKKQSGKTVAAKSSFITGVLSGFRDKLRRHTKQSGNLAPDEKTALVALNGRELEDYVAQRHPRLVTRGMMRGRRDLDTFYEGHSQGERLTLNKPMTQPSGPRGVLLT